ncbi:MAG: diguanylate cyclase [Fidelibacterota bacterium]|nr:MAG: diguanylate cyclase [Candidatus Neomarinimicrobiota bacterium]
MTKGVSLLVQFWTNLTEPSGRVQAPDERRRARLLANLSVVIFLLILLSIIIRQSLAPYDSLAAFLPTLAALITQTVTYTLARSRYHFAGALFFVIIGCLVSLWRIIAVPNDAAPAIMILPLLIGSILLPMRTIMILYFVVLAGLLSLPVFIPELAYKYTLTAFIMVLISIAIILIGKHHRNNLEADRQRDLQELATLDPLTALFNRRRFSEFLQHEIERAKRYSANLSVIMFDIDHFKKINDTFGHQEGDGVLKAFSRRIKSIIRESDLVARWGGEEFMILAVNTDAKNAEAIAEKIRSDIETQEFLNKTQFTVSAGVAQFRITDTAESLIERVDQALYTAKNGGRNQVRVFN